MKNKDIADKYADKAAKIELEADGRYTREEPYILAILYRQASWLWSLASSKISNISSEHQKHYEQRKIECHSIAEELDDDDY